MNKRNLFSYDAETNGLWGQAFSVAAIVETEDGQRKEFVGRCPISGDVNPWVRDNVLPVMEGIPENYPDYRSLLQGFVEFWKANKADATALVHMGQPVEARLWIDAHEMGLIGDWDAPYCQVDLGSFPEIGDSVDTYCAQHDISAVAEAFAGGTHNPLYDSEQALRAYKHYMNW